jgi:hypothetical protein
MNIKTRQCDVSAKGFCERGMYDVGNFVCAFTRTGAVLTLGACVVNTQPSGAEEGVEVMVESEVGKPCVAEPKILHSKEAFFPSAWSGSFFS